MTTTLVAQQKYSKVKIYTGSDGLQFLAEQGLPVDHGILKKDISFTTILSESDITTLNANGFFYDIVIDDMHDHYRKRSLEENVNLKNAICPTNGSGIFDPVVPSNFDVMPTYMGFYRYNEMLAELDDMFAQYPNLISQKSPISTIETIEGRPIYHVKISDNPTVEEAEPEVLYTAIHHAREPLSMSETIFFMWYLLENYGTNPEVTFLVDHTEMYFVPCINVDGYLFNETDEPNGGGMHRKNRRNVGTTNKGVDLNRNYSYGWNTTGVSANTNNDTYPGTAAFSEPETQAMKWLNENHNFISTFNAHTYGNTLLHPIGTTAAEFADHHLYFSDLTQFMCSENGFFPQKSSGLYPASGDSDDYQYKEDIGVGLKDTVFAITPEVGSEFWPPVNEIIPSCKEMVLPNLTLSHMAHKYLVVKEDDPSSNGTLSGNFHHTVQRLGLEDGSVTVTLVPLQNIQTLGNAVIYNLPVRAIDDANVSFTLNPAIEFGDEVKYVIETNYGLWVDRDTIVKTYGAITEQLTDNGNSAVNWTGNWNTTTSAFYSASSSFTDSPTGDYANNVNSNFTFNQDIDLTIATSAMISFYAKWEIEADYDYCQFQVSVDGGNTWIGQCGNYTVPGTSASGSVQPNNQPVWEGIQSSWVREEINLSDYLGETLKVRFKLQADGGAREDGFYFDDFTVAYNVEDTSGSGLGISEISDLGISLYPNPSNGIFEMSGLEVGSKVSIVDLTGKVILEENIKSTTLKFDLKENASGTYIVKTRKDDTIVEHKFVIQK